MAPHKAAVHPNKHLLISMESKITMMLASKKMIKRRMREVKASGTDGGRVGETGLGCVSSCIIINNDSMETSTSTTILSDAHLNVRSAAFMTAS